MEQQATYGTIDLLDYEPIRLRSGIWNAIADRYSVEGVLLTPGTCLMPDDPEYPKQILSLLSDAQERANGDLGQGVNDMLNAAKVMLMRMTIAKEANAA